MSTVLENGRVLIMDGGDTVFDTNDQVLHELGTMLSGSVNLSQREYHSYFDPVVQNFDLGAVHPQADFIYGLARVRYSTGVYQLPNDRWFDIGGSIVLEHCAFQMINGQFSTYPSAMFIISFILSGGHVTLNATSALYNDYYGGGVIKANVSYRIWGGKFT